MNIFESMNYGFEKKYKLREAKEDKERFLSFINAMIKDNIKSQSIVDNFDKLKSSGRIKGQEADYYYWIKNKTVAELQDFLNAFNSTLSKTQTRKEEKKGAEQINCPNKDWLIYKINTYDASKYYGKGSTWCISGNYKGHEEEGEYWFDYYKGDEPNKDGGYIEDPIKDYYFLWQIGNEENGKWCYLDYGKDLQLNNDYFYDAQDYSHVVEKVDIPNDVLLSLPGISQKLVDDAQEKKDRKLKQQEIMAEVQRTGIYTYNLLDNNPFIQKLNPKKIVIPNSVTEIGNYAFYGCKSLQEITIPNSVTQIGERAFDKCTSLQKIVIPNSVTQIGNYAFDKCTSLKEITIPNGVTKIGNWAFFGCTSLKEITIPNNVIKIEDFAFGNCTSLKEITIPNGVIEIGYSAFSHCTSLKEITIPNSVTQIGDYAFYYCTSLKEITIPNSVKEIGNSAFSNCKSLKEITIPNGVKEIGNYVFYNCGSLQKITIPNSVTEIENYAFSGCTSLQQINIPNSVTEIGDWVFVDCTSLQEITIPNGVKEIGNYAFYNCGSLQKITIKGKYNPKMFKNTGLEDTVILNWIDCDIKETWRDIKNTI